MPISIPVIQWTDAQFVRDERELEVLGGEMNGTKCALGSGQGSPRGMFARNMDRGKIFRTSSSFVAVRVSDQRFSAEHRHGTVRIFSYRGIAVSVDIHFGNDAAWMRVDYHALLRVPRHQSLQRVAHVLGNQVLRASTEYAGQDRHQAIIGKLASIVNP